MKRTNSNQISCQAILKTGLLTLLMVTIPALASSGGPYELSWSTIDGGGGVSSGGQYVLEGTIGQPDAAYSAGGQYEVSGGFWSGGPLCVVNFEHYARFAEWWMVTGSGIPADLYKDEYDIVDWYDLDVFVDEWLDYCRLDWPLK